MKPFQNVIKSADQLEEIWGKPGKLAANKVIPYLDAHCINFLSLSPFVVIGTSNADGECDVSPRGDHPGFILVLNEKQLVIPERPGNKRLDSIRNLLENHHASLLCIIPGLDETLRITGKASIIKDPDILEQMKAKGKTPIAGIAVEVGECFIHCGKAMKRSHLWNHTEWHAAEELPKANEILAEHAKSAGLDAVGVAAALEESYRKRMY
ncbi:pyridoxamine 5'-phosphate oxidase family protein [Bacillus sp. FJAT-42376]|uniref:MSMEG_1061 family FMN-dependent PPOX-type flavoprotein n=1 Tax=Bacillus sp. FJAT-42376 TaxID=2014076 RepID=UPI000F4FF436|nr:MSMEG_1061 family FMN-dependent PPOX-type flavoprotein [Bacillus sp. FJAT-42376]AZB41875.1 pyridoxamine 5'-phosphate oxidase family protein [Bacillus sp. FJAT-42376]